MELDATSVAVFGFGWIWEGENMQSIQQMATGAGQIANSATSVASALARPRATASGSPDGNGASTSAAASTSTISANDFLTLLVAEMKNQDPTQPTDPNAYITQMVDVNSLQQLIGINQGVTSLDSSVGAVGGTSSSEQQALEQRRLMISVFRPPGRCCSAESEKR